MLLTNKTKKKRGTTGKVYIGGEQFIRKYVIVIITSYKKVGNTTYSLIRRYAVITYGISYKKVYNSIQ